MSLSILNNIPAMQAQNQLTQTNASLQKTLFRLASGSKLNSGADDAAGLSIANGLTANVAALTQSAANASNGVGQLQTADGALSQVTTLLNRAVTLATEASTSTINATQAKSLDTEFQSIKAEIDRIGGKTTFNNQNVFGSSASGSNGTWTSGTGMGAGNGNVAFTNTATQTITLNDTATGHSLVLQTATATTGGSGSAASPYKAGNLNDMVAEINSYAAASGTKMNVTASVSAAGKLVLTDTSGTGSLVASADVTASTDLGAVTVGVNTTTDPNSWASTTGTLALTSNSSSSAGKFTIIDSDTNTSKTFDVAANETVGSLINAINAASGTKTDGSQVNVTASLNSAGQLQIKDNSGNGSIMVSTTADNLGSMTDTTSGAGAGSSNAVYLGDGTATTSANTISTNIASLSATKGLALSQDLTSTTSAQAALKQITDAIAQIAQQRGGIGASINRLNAATNVINNQIENLSSAQNSISAADISAEVSNMTKYNVLTQTGISALSQSNQMQQALLKLLQ